VTGAELAAAIGPGLAKAAVAVKIDGRPRDLATLIDHDAAVAIITRDAPEGVEILRHDAAHVMAEAVKELYPDTQVTFGPATETGFYYDFARAEPFTSEDLGQIEARMRDIVRREEDHPVSGARCGRAFWDLAGNQGRVRRNPGGGDQPLPARLFVVCVGPHLP
jgi:threonyl-tRNA synthetase